MSSVQQFCEDLSNIDLNDPKAKEVMMERIKKYDENFAQTNFHPTPSQLSQNYKKDTSKIQLPSNGSEMEKQLKTQFIADGSIFGEYQQILRQAHVPAFVVPPPPPPKPEEQAAQIFLRLPYNYLDQNANSKNESNILQQPQNHQLSQLSNLFSTIQHQNQIQNQNQQQQIQNPSAIQANILNNQQQMDLQMQMNQTPNGLDSDFITNIKKTVNVLGGIEDTVQIMKQSLQDYELQHQVERKIEKQPIFKNSTLMNPLKGTQTPTNPQQYHPFERYMATEQLSVIQQSQRLREQKLQQNVHQ
ncbi:unnamed protein product (macronuclear) [Paramecium tetraurelia]|uniref:Chromosome undetermined scaffold_1, whole genome shotgun sequence n=1 Tax=Paramecium tetraurelia TaxID=5888 RepID=Q6BFD9_PARTE|nr:hypothetical protein [Paramecium tetraurelia strain d4-2]XP_001423000.1 uncharacterized protein GSPATT00000037001 [Paramecium tetraurelia]CAH03632.1 hypothetical protein PTMB.432c [Paramecium tetraurelia]CAK55602.1 unnamed protein product [Paramecium tetraurelia]|eukprot:XP_001423000.1 hypothetical protein (macronuclear) [Paramecium tetraurelia strain d4-2]